MAEIILENQNCNYSDIKLTPLRQDILNILVPAQYPITAYEILSKLKKKRPNAEPPTVYRVLDFLMENKLVHRLESENKYVYCSHTQNDRHHSVLFFCKNCQKTLEFMDEAILSAIRKLAQKHIIRIDDEVIEMRGYCQDCVVTGK